jgi:hypothetical protein
MMAVAVTARMWVVVVVDVHTLEQARLAARRRRIVALPRLPDPNLRILLPGTASAAFRPRRALNPAIAHVSRVCKPVVWILLLELERTLFHSRPIPVAGALADVYRRVCAPAVTKAVPIFPVAWGAGAHGRYGCV